MTASVRLLLHGASGRMGQALLRLCEEQEGCQVVAAVATRVGQRVVDGVPWFTAAELGGVPDFDVAVDFSLPEAFDPVLALCRQRGAALVSGTTGLSEAQGKALDEAAAGIPVLWASNFSIGVA
ncbi:MAG: 4-hydroxy-tetrahydrodipicolinate reductase, partial [Luteimonas sp.]